MPPLIAKLNEMRRDFGREHLPFDVVMVLKDKWDVDQFRRPEEMGVTVIQLLPAFFTLGRRSTLDEKKRFWSDFAEKVLRHFSLSVAHRAKSEATDNR